VRSPGGFAHGREESHLGHPSRVRNRPASHGVRAEGRTVPAVLRVLLIRHGQSEWNAVGRWQGQADPPLTDLGRLQAAHAAQHVGAVDAVVASDLERSRATGEIIADVLGIGPVLVEPGLRERHAGEWQGLTKAEIAEQWPGYLEERRRPPAFEPDEDFQARIFGALDRLRGDVADGDVLAVAHAGVVYQVEELLGAGFEPLPNVAGRWIEDAGDGPWRLGERVTLVDPDELTVPRVQ
jgi:broad specificity phosphatase PhoE